MTPVRGRVQETALTVGALFGLVCIVGAMAAMLFGITPLVFRSGSMSPTITTGSVALGREIPATEARAGDIVSVDRADGSRITHRIQSVDSVAGNSATLTLKGDANETADERPYIVTTVTKVVGHVPYLGYFVAWLSTPIAWAIGALLAASLIWIAFRPASPRTPRDPPRHGRHSKSKHSSVVVPIVLVTAIATVVGVGFSRSESTAAAGSDTAYGRAAVKVGFLGGPSTFSCINSGSKVDLAFRSNDDRFTYQLTFTGGGLLNGPPPPVIFDRVQAGTVVTYRPAGALLGLGSTTTATLITSFNSFVSAPLTRSYTATLLGRASCSPAGSTSGVAAQSARIAQAPAAEAPSTSPTTTATTSPNATSGTSPTTTTSTSTPTTTTSSTAPPTTTAPTTTTTTVPPTTTTTTPPPPPASAFIADGSSRVKGDNTASVTDGRLSITDASGAEVFSRSVTPTARYGTGVTWSSDGNLYILSENADPVRVDSDFTAAAVPMSALPTDIAALL